MMNTVWEWWLMFGLSQALVVGATVEFGWMGGAVVATLITPTAIGNYDRIRGY